jgi:hypothetical protein
LQQSADGLSYFEIYRWKDRLAKNGRLKTLTSAKVAEENGKVEIEEEGINCR